MKRALPDCFYEGIEISPEEVDHVMAEYLATPRGRAVLLEACATRLAGWLAQAEEPSAKATIIRLVHIVDFVLEAVGEDEVVSLRLLVPFLRARTKYVL